MALVAAAAPGQVAAEGDAPETYLTIDIDTSTGDFSAETRILAPEGDVILPRADWLSVDGVSIASSDSSLEVLPHNGALGPGLHRNGNLRVTLSGRLPAPQRRISQVASEPEATYAIGPVWFPADATDIRDHHISVTVPISQTVAATGTFVSEEVGADTREVRFVFTGRSADVGLFVGPYAVDERDHGGLRLRTYFETADAELSQRYFEALSAYLDRYRAEIGDYPYDGFSVVSAPVPVGLGFAGLTYVSRDILSHPYMTGRSLAHEVLHSWWGNAVSVDYATGNWAEGLTTYQADYALAADRGAEAARDMRIAWIRDLARLSDDAMRPLAMFRSAYHTGDQSEGYGKAALVFHMLRDEIGAAAFGGAIRTFYAENRDAIAGWRDLRAAFEATSGRDLAWFFAQWIDRAGLPEIEIAEATLRQSRDDSAEVTLRIRQALPVYRLRVPLVFETMTGEERRVARLDGATSTHDFTLPARPVAVRLDPDFDLARRPVDGELAPILRSIAGAETILAVAASSLEGRDGRIAEALSAMTGGTDLVWRRGPVAPTEGGAVLMVGLREDVSARRPPHLGPVPDIAEEGATRLWIERDADGALWGFLSFDSLEDVSADLAPLRYYTGQSYVAFDGGRAVARGVWPTSSSPPAVRFEPPGAGEALR